jgi:predicted 3-demethylubiquinone-9 3-methyltransferase (glyoxalase superfamily)
MRDITPALVFNSQAEEAAKFYVSVFSNVSRKSKILHISRYTDEELKALTSVPEEIRPGPVGSVLTVLFLLNGQEFTATNGGPYFTFCQGLSLYVKCETQAEIDMLWEKLSEGGEKQPCGWVKDKFGVSWQIAPKILDDMMTDPDPARVSRVMVAILGMQKYDIAELRKVYSGS